ncbi:MAG: o-succinylbenzoate--CoA ligase [Ignavibacteriales bacterium]|nr:o-succinylbenzoate--CoA ligase [Ignavibacteriales bacterium]
MNIESNLTTKKILIQPSFRIKSGGNSFDFSAISSRVMQFQKILFERKISKGDYAAVLSENNLEFIISILALWQIEAIPVLINTRLTKPEIENQIVFCKIVLTSSSQKKIFSEFSKPCLEIILSSELPVKKKDEQFNLSHPAVIIFTSGSTSKPKAVELSFNSLYQSFKSADQILHQSEDDKWLASLPFYHIGGFSIFTRALFAGCTLILPDDSSVESIGTSIQEEKPSLLSLVSPQLKGFVDKKISPNPELRIVLIGGGRVDSDLIASAINLGWNIYKVYGSTETASFISILSPAEFKLKKESAGKPIPPNVIIICDTIGNKLPANRSGEITIKANTLFSKYLFDDETTSQKLSNGVYYSGDVGYLDEDGYLFIKGRSSDLIISGGENINSFEVEAAIKIFPGVKEVCVFPISDKKWGQRTIAAIVPYENIRIDFEKLKLNLREYLADYKIPKEFYIFDSLPKSSLGKVLRKKIIHIYMSKNEGDLF